MLGYVVSKERIMISENKYKVVKECCVDYVIFLYINEECNASNAESGMAKINK